MKRAWKIAAGIFVLLILVGASIDFWVVKSTEDHIIIKAEGEEIRFDESPEAVKELKADCIIVPGAGVDPDGKPSKMLADRLNLAVELYRMGVAPKILLSGDNGQPEYNEVVTMQRHVMKAGVAEEDIFLDHAGFSTYETMHRAKNVFLVDSAVVVTQKYHLYRSLYIGQNLGLEVYGAAADQKKYAGQSGRDIREALARGKDFFKCMTKPEPTFLGPEISIHGDGRSSWE